jgi:hypothetical protein
VHSIMIYSTILRSITFDYVVKNKDKLLQSPKFKKCEKIIQEDDQICKHLSVCTPIQVKEITITDTNK